MEKFRIRSYKVRELAVIYFPGKTPTAASQRFRMWMKKNEELMTELQETCYNTRLHSLTPRQVGIIVKHLGDPTDYQKQDNI